MIFLNISNIHNIIFGKLFEKHRSYNNFKNCFYFILNYLFFFILNYWNITVE